MKTLANMKNEFILVNQITKTKQMKYLFTFLVLTFGITQFAHAGLDKAEKKRLKKELKNYKKHPEQYKSMIENYKTTIDSNESSIATQKNELIAAATKQSELEAKVSKLDQELTECMNKPVPKCPEAAAPGQIPSTGDAFKVQFGLYEKFDLNPYFDKAKFIGYEKVEGLNRYVISYFETEEQAQSFVKDIRKMGIRDAFVAKYTDGARVFEWEKNPKYKGKKAPASMKEGIEKK